jgi:hypothetical protein
MGFNSAFKGLKVPFSNLDRRIRLFVDVFIHCRNKSTTLTFSTSTNSIGTFCTLFQFVSSLKSTQHTHTHTHTHTHRPITLMRIPTVFLVTYMYTCVHIRTYIHTYIHTHTHTHTHILLLCLLPSLMPWIMPFGAFRLRTNFGVRMF